LVLFDSAVVEHEVLATKSVRWALVGWFMMDGTKKRDGGREGRQSKESSFKQGKKRNKKKATRSKHRHKL
jgi:hypothetical protein